MYTETSHVTFEFVTFLAMKFHSPGMGSRDLDEQVNSIADTIAVTYKT